MRRAPLVILSALLLSFPARAADPDSLRRATAAYAEGMDLRASGHPEASLEKLKLAHQLFPTPITGLELGRAYVLLGKLLEAREALASVTRMSPRAGESARANTARAEAAALGLELAERIPRIVFGHEGGPAPAVRVDGITVTDLDTPYRLNPGQHTVEWAGTSRPVMLSERQALDLSLTTAARAPAEVVPAPDSPPASSRTIFWLGVAVTSAAAASGTVSGIVAIGDANNARPSCPANQCAPSVHGSADAAKTWSTVSTASFIGAGVFGVATIVAYFLTGPTSKEPPQVGSLSLSF